MLPFPILLVLGSGLGRILFLIPSNRKIIAKRNIEICFPELDVLDQKRLLKDNFINMGVALMEVGMAWWWPKRRLQKLIVYEGLEHIENIHEEKGTILLGIHYTTLEIGGAAVSMVTQMDGMYRAHGNPVYDYVQANGRVSKGSGNTVVFERRDVRGSMKALKNGRTLWYGPDQDYGLLQGLFAPFFGVQAATVYATARFAEKTKSAVVPFSHIRLPGLRGYKVVFYPALDSFPSGDDLIDATRINRIIEDFIRLKPDQYLWAHRRFKNRPPGEADLYNVVQEP
jgi:KDO2-lipid IV(A) lauroyltransferase